MAAPLSAAKQTIHCDRGWPVPGVQQIVDDPLMRQSAILVFANKQDLVGLKLGCGDC